MATSFDIPNTDAIYMISYHMIPFILDKIYLSIYLSIYICIYIYVYIYLYIYINIVSPPRAGEQDEDLC
jgi:hypothetical protein